MLLARNHASRFPFFKKRKSPVLSIPTSLSPRTLVTDEEDGEY